MADWLADRGARRLILAGRTPLPPRRDWDDTADPVARRRIAAIRALEQRGVAVEVAGVDVASPGALRQLVDRRDQDGAPPVRGVIHAAGVTGDHLVTGMSDATARRVMAPKIGGAQALHTLFPAGQLDFLFLTASAGSVFGVPGQGAYAAANAYLDCLAHARHRQGCHTVSLDWVAWEGLGFAADAQWCPRSSASGLEAADRRGGVPRLGVRRPLRRGPGGDGAVRECGGGPGGERLHRSGHGRACQPTSAPTYCRAACGRSWPENCSCPT